VDARHATPKLPRRGEMMRSGNLADPDGHTVRRGTSQAHLAWASAAPPCRGFHVQAARRGGSGEAPTLLLPDIGGCEVADPFMPARAAMQVSTPCVAGHLLVARCASSQRCSQRR
jgi:hypothetical protein